MPPRGLPGGANLEQLKNGATAGDRDRVERVLAQDPNLRDGSYHSTPAGWAEHFGKTEARQSLAAREQ